MDKSRFGREMYYLGDEELQHACDGCGIDRIEWQGNKGKGYKKANKIIAVKTVLKVLNAIVTSKMDIYRRYTRLYSTYVNYACAALIGFRC